MRLTCFSASSSKSGDDSAQRSLSRETRDFLGAGTPLSARDRPVGHAVSGANRIRPEPGEHMFRRAALAVTFSAWMFGCASNTDDTQEIIDNLIQAGFPASEIMVVNGVVYTGRDAAVSLEASREMLTADPGKEQYRTTNLVSQTLANICVNGSKLGKEPF